MERARQEVEFDMIVVERSGVGGGGNYGEDGSGSDEFLGEKRGRRKWCGVVVIGMEEEMMAVLCCC